MKTKVFKIDLMVIDFDEVGEPGVKELIENTKYPNWAISPKVMDVESNEVEWADDHPLNYRDTQIFAFQDLFPSKEYLRALRDVEDIILDSDIAGIDKDIILDILNSLREY